MKVSLAALALTLAASSAAARGFSAVVSFGDSLSDAGAFGFRSTTEPSLSWTQLLAAAYGTSQTANEHGPFETFGKAVAGVMDPAGLDYAEGGARVKAMFGNNPDGMPISGFAQLDHYLRQHGRFTGRELVTVYLGTNDILIPILTTMRGEAASHPLSAPERETIGIQVEQAARDLGRLVARMLAAGADRIVVLNLYDLGMSPVAATPALKEALSAFSAAFDVRLSSSLPKDSRLVPVDTRRFLAGLAADRARQGFTHPASEDACTAGPNRPDCYQAAYWKSPDAPETYMFIGGVHFTAHTNRLLAAFVRQQIEAGGTK